MSKLNEESISSENKLKLLIF